MPKHSEQLNFFSQPSQEQSDAQERFDSAEFARQVGETASRPDVQLDILKKYNKEAARDGLITMDDVTKETDSEIFPDDGADREMPHEAHTVGLGEEANEKAKTAAAVSNESGHRPVCGDCGQPIPCGVHTVLKNGKIRTIG